MIEIEVWIPIKGYEGIYQVSNTGKIRSLDRMIDLGSRGTHLYKGTEIKQAISNCGYKRAHLSKNGIGAIVSVHRIVAKHFIVNPDNKPCINHKDGIKKNNAFLNLEWCTHKENIAHSFKNGLSKHQKGLINERNGMSKPVAQYSLSGELIKNWPSSMEVQRRHGFRSSGISNCRAGRIKTSNGFIWKDINETISSDEIIRVAFRSDKKIQPERPIGWKPSRVNQSIANAKRCNMPIIDLNTGVFYNNAQELSDLLGVNRRSVCDWVHGGVKNIKRYQYA